MPCIILEALRITSLPKTLFRKAMQDVVINGYTIPKGWAVVLHLLGMRLDSDLFPDPLTFNPWCWEEASAAKIASTLLPFGGGPRYCPGSELAKLEASIFLHHLVTKYNWELAGDDKTSWFPDTSLSGHLPLKLTDRKQ
eukprot:c17893_g1_i1 orf=310-726(+)